MGCGGSAGSAVAALSACDDVGSTGVGSTCTTS